MNVGDLTAKIQANKKPLAIAGAAGVAGLALMQRKKAGGDVSASAPVAGSSTSSLASPNGQVVYSSEASDVYNALQPQLSTVSTGVAQLLADKSAAEAADAIPVPGTNAEWIRQATTGWVREGNNAIDIQEALNAYTKGAPISKGTQSGINWTIKNYGAAPEGTNGISHIIPGSA